MSQYTQKDSFETCKVLFHKHEQFCTIVITLKEEKLGNEYIGLFVSWLVYF